MSYWLYNLLCRQRREGTGSVLLIYIKILHVHMVPRSPQSLADESMMNIIWSCSSSSLRPRSWKLVCRPFIYVPRKTNAGRRQLAKVIVIIWKPSSVSLWMITIWILLWRHHDTGTNILWFPVMRNFLQITCVDQFILREKRGWFCRGMHFIRRSKRALIY